MLRLADVRVLDNAQSLEKRIQPTEALRTD
jgi:hypothetical protein